uniref:Uncharacterized protein LOC105130257 n=1 Tax=Rhizophora mucronata TaxID=61149 RepID=A0A2P2IYH4_RHIMU
MASKKIVRKNLFQFSWRPNRLCSYIFVGSLIEPRNEERLPSREVERDARRQRKSWDPRDCQVACSTIYQRGLNCPPPVSPNLFLQFQSYCF